MTTCATRHPPPTSSPGGRKDVQKASFRFRPECRLTPTPFGDSTKKAAEPIWEEQKSLLEENEKLDLGGITIGAINWWISGIYLPTTKEEETRNVFSYEEAEENTITLESFSGYYYDAYSLTRDHLENFFEMYAFADEDEDTRLYTGVFADLLDEGAGVSLGLHSDDKKLAHAVTLWGAEYMENHLSKIWITDSDDNEGLLEIEVSVEGDKIYLVDYANGYEGIYIEQVYAISPSEAKAWGIPEPSYTILPLITLLGVLIRRRRK